MLFSIVRPPRCSLSMVESRRRYASILHLHSKNTLQLTWALAVWPVPRFYSAASALSIAAHKWCSNFAATMWSTLVWTPDQFMPKVDVHPNARSAGFSFQRSTSTALLTQLA